MVKKSKKRQKSLKKMPDKHEHLETYKKHNSVKKNTKKANILEKHKKNTYF